MTTSSSGLSQLAGQTPKPPTKPWKPLLISLGAVVGFLLVIGLLLGDQLQPRIEVSVTRALLLPGTATSEPVATSSTVLFQSSGWVEADPWTVNVPALADGIVEEVLFKEGDLVEAGQLLVRFVAEDAELNLAKQSALLAQAELQCQAHAAGTRAAEQALAQAQARETRAEAELEEAKDRWFRVRDLSLAEVSESIKVEAEQQFYQQQSALAEAQSHRKQTEELLDQQRHREQAHDQLRESLAVAKQEAELRKSRMTLRAPMAGRVKKRMVEPGGKRMRNMDDPDSAIVAELYDPDHLQVRVDVPLAEAGKLAVGQPATVSTALLPGKTFSGTVTSIVGMADLQRNTLQAKVRIHQPDPKLRPETLSRVAFHPAPETENDETGTSVSTSIWIPADLVDPDQESPTVWVVSRTEETVSRRSLKRGTGRRDGYVEILEGLRANERVVTESESPLHEGARVTLQEKDI